MDIKTANRLQQLRKVNGYSQDALAEQLGISRQAISKWERAESSPDTDNLIALADLYGMTLDELLNSTNDKVEISLHDDENNNSNSVKGSIKNHIKLPSLYGALGKKLVKTPFPLLVVIVYVVASYLTDLWHPLWLVFLTIPIYYHFAGACFTKTHKAFMLALPIPEIIVTIYLILGFSVGIWSPSWIIFLIIPLYYWYCSARIKNVKPQMPTEATAETVEK